MVDRSENINQMIREYYELAQRVYKTRHDWVGKVILPELWNRVKFNQAKKIAYVKTEFVLETRKHKVL